MQQDRRGFLRLALFAAPAAPAAELLLKGRGGSLNVLEPSTPEAIAKARKALDAAGVVEPFAHGLFELRSDALYDRLLAPPGESFDQWHFFTEPIGSCRRGQWEPKTFLDTNSVRANQLPPPCEAYVERILFLFDPGMLPSDRADLIDRYYFEFRLADKIVARAPLARCPVAGYLDSLMLELSGNCRPRRRVATLHVDGSGSPSPFFLHLARPVHIPAMCQYSFSLFGQRFKARDEIKLYAFLDGMFRYGVQ